ncbi:MAG: sensor domain-containing diguanylate cyclase [Anaerolineae bacterium]|nr:sensor domain-containing diguanylate cyclase [Anaerolineae bacterium]
MNQFRERQVKALPYITVITAYGLVIAFFAAYHNTLGDSVAALFTIPIFISGWFYGIRGGISTAIFSILFYTRIRYLAGESFISILTTPSTLIGAFALILVAVIVGELATTTRERRIALIRLTHSNELIYSLIHVTTHIEKALNPDEIIQVLGEELRKIKLFCAIALFDTDHKTLTINPLSLDQSQLDELEKAVGFPLKNFKFSPNLSELHVENVLQPAVISSLRGELQILLPHEVAKTISNSMLTDESKLKIEIFRLLLMFEENLLGILWVWGSGVSSADLPVMSIFAKQIGISLERARLFREVQSLALTDPLTGLHNRRSLFELGRIEFSRADRFKRPFCCLMLDLDHFKQINDTHGHQTGDVVLQEFARRCKASVREIDLVGRYGGEEVVILMPETEIETAVKVAERIRFAICNNPFSITGMNLNITASIGVSTKDDNTPSLDTLIARADQAMYIAKHKGRNRVAVSR